MYEEKQDFNKEIAEILMGQKTMRVQHGSKKAIRILLKSLVALKWRVQKKETIYDHGVLMILRRNDSGLV